MRFDELQLNATLLRAVIDAGYTEPTPIQAQAIPHVLAGNDLLGCAQTGTGKTAAFALPILQRLAEQSEGQRPSKRPIRALILAPTRELATQIYDNFKVYGRHMHLKYATVYGGVSPRPQIDNLRRGVDILVATPGRLLDLMGQGHIHLDQLNVLVLDEADRMLDMGFLPDVRRIINTLPKRRQTLLFSATIPADIQNLASSILIDPLHIEVTPEQITVEAIEQVVYFVEKKQKRDLLEYLLRNDDVTRALIFTRTKHQANRLSEQLEHSAIRAEAIHGNKSQGARERALANFKRGKTRVLVATDIAARGIDVDDVSHVINYELPNETESYVHRIGRTGRAGAAGKAYSFCSAEEREYLIDIERLIRMNITVVTDHPYNSQLGIPAPTDLSKPKHTWSSKRQSGSKSGAFGSKKRGGNRRRRGSSQKSASPIR